MTKKKFGFLEKEGKASDLIRTGFQRRLFVLKTDSTVDYYSDRGYEKILSNADMKARGGVIKDQCKILDLKQANPNLAGFGGIVQHGRFLILSPYRNTFEPANGILLISSYFIFIVLYYYCPQLSHQNLSEFFI